MGIFSGHKKKDELVLVFNVGSSFVGGALFWTQQSGIPKIIFSVREPIAVEEKVDIDRFLSLTLQSLEIVVNKVSEAKLGAPSKIFCVLPSPWLVSQTRIINFKKNTPFIFTAKLADELVQKEIKLFEEEKLVKYKDVSSSVRSIEFKNIKISLNGYETAQPLNQKATELEMVIFVSVSGEQILRKIEDTIAKHFHFEQIKFSSFTMATFTVVRDMFPKQENFLLIYIGGEVTDISMVKKNTLRESISFPIGCNFLARGVASSLGCSLSEANSLISLFKDGHAEEKLTKKLIPIIKELKAEWLKSFQEALAHLSNDISIPATIYIYMGKDLADFFGEAIKTEQFSQYTLTESKFEIVFLNTELFHGKAVFEESVIREPFLLVDSIYINRFLIYPA
jgi:hypothetical protein